MLGEENSGDQISYLNGNSPDRPLTSFTIPFNDSRHPASKCHYLLPKHSKKSHTSSCSILPPNHNKSESLLITHTKHEVIYSIMYHYIYIYIELSALN